MRPYAIAMQSQLEIFDYVRPDRRLRSNTEFLVLAGGGDIDPHLLIGIGPKSSGDEVCAPDDLAVQHVLVATRLGGEAPGVAGTFLLNRALPIDLEMPAFFRAGQFFPADGVAEVLLSGDAPSLSVLGRHAHRRDEHDRIVETTERGMRSRVHLEGRVSDVRAALAWRFAGTRLPWSLERAPEFW
jgi:hypothetical protein